MRRIAVYSLTRDRLKYTRVAFQSLRDKAGLYFDHFVYDNGSDDETVDWLTKEYKPYKCTLGESNIGISKASNHLLDEIFSRNHEYDIVCKYDNDAVCKSENILGQIAEIMEAFPEHGPKYILSPRVEGIVNQPKRVRETMLARRRIGLTAIIGGLFHCVPASVYKRYRYPETLPLAKGQDDHFCDWFRKQGGECGYIEGLVVEHYKGTEQQAVEEPEYFKRKFSEEV